jgi:methyl-accepting chemotaxis protein
LITIIIGGIIVCSVLGASGLWMPFAPAAAAVLGGVGMILIIKWHRSRHLLPDARGYRERDDLLKPAFEIAVRISYIGRISRRRGMALLESTAGFLTVCERLRARLEKCEQLSEGKESTASEAGGPAREEVADWKSEETTGALGAMLEEVTSTVREMAGVLRDVDHNAKELITSTEETAYSMTRLDSFLQDMANSGRDLEASTDTANRVALEGTKVVEEMGKENEAIISTVNEAASAVEDLGRWSQEVGKIVEVIRDIANETNLLALNASIIAAQSGEHGKAFGVVAEEIRGLAERTSSSTKEISDLVKAVQKNVANVVNGMKKSLQRVERGELLTRNAGTVLEKVF